MPTKEIPFCSKSQTAISTLVRSLLMEMQSPELEKAVKKRPSNFLAII